MKTNSLLSRGSMAALMFALVGCGREKSDPGGRPEPAAERSASEKIKAQARDAVTATRDYLTEQKDALLNSLSDKMSGFDKQLAGWKEKADRSSGKAKAEWADTVAHLQQKKQTAAEKLTKLKDSGTNAWQEVKVGAEAAFADLEKAFKEAAAKFKSEAKPAE